MCVCELYGLQAPGALLSISACRTVGAAFLSARRGFFRVFIIGKEAMQIGKVGDLLMGGAVHEDRSVGARLDVLAGEAQIRIVEG